MDLDDEELKATRMMNGADRKGRVNKMEQDIKDIELFIDFCRAPYNFEHESEEKSYKELSYKIEHLIKAYKELEEENKDLKNLANNKQWISPCYVAQNYIPVSLVEEKIEEINKLITEAQKELGSASKEYTIYVYQKDILQELLEKRR